MSETDLALIVLPLVASAIHAFGFWKYNSQAKAGTSKPNFVSWAIWALLASLNALSFMAITSFVVAAQTFVGAVGCIGIFVHALVTGKFEWPRWKEWVIFAISIVAIVVWKFYNPLYANLVLISAFFLSFWPSWIGVWVDPTKEKSLPWLLWGLAHGLTAFSAFLLGGLSLKLAMPIFGVLAHWLVPVICSFQRRRA